MVVANLTVVMVWQRQQQCHGGISNVAEVVGMAVETIMGMVAATTVILETTVEAMMEMAVEVTSIMVVVIDMSSLFLKIAKVRTFYFHFFSEIIKNLWKNRK